MRKNKKKRRRVIRWGGGGGRKLLKAELRSKGGGRSKNKGMRKGQRNEEGTKGQRDEERIKQLEKDCGGLHLVINIYFISCSCLANYGASEAVYPCVVVEKIHESL